MRSLPGRSWRTCRKKLCPVLNSAPGRTRIRPTLGTKPILCPENLFLAYQRSGKSFYRDMAKQFLEDDTYFDPLSQGNNVLPFEHAYSHVNAFSSAMQAYITLGSEKHLRAAKNGFEMLQTTQSFRDRRLGTE